MFSLFVFQVNRIKTPKQLDEFVEMESESGNPVAKFFFRTKAEIHGVKIGHISMKKLSLTLGFYSLYHFLPSIRLLHF